MNKLAPGTVIDQRFEILEEIGHGGMGVVYRARQTDFSRDVAIKFLRDGLTTEPEKMKRFQREAHVISRLDHPNIVKVYAIGQQNGLPYIAMEFLQGRQLSDIVEAGGPIEWKRALPLFMQACDALAYAHQQQIVHRDIKPSNIVVTQDTDGEFSNVKIVDFGIAKSLASGDEKLTRTEMVLGSVFYLSPGQFQGRAADPLADIYSLGCTFFEVLAGKPPFVGDTIFDTIAQKTHNAIPSVNSVYSKADIPSSLQSLLEAMMQSDSSARPESALAVKEILQKIEAGQAVQLPTVKKTAASAQRGKRFIWGSALIVGLVAASLMLSQPHQGQSPSEYITNSDSERSILARMRERHSNADQVAFDYYDLAQCYADEGFPIQGYLAARQGLLWLGEHKTNHAYSDLMYVLGETETYMGKHKQAMADLDISENTRGLELPLATLVQKVNCQISAGEFGPAATTANKLIDAPLGDSQQRAFVQRAVYDEYPALICARMFPEAFRLKERYIAAATKQAADYKDPYARICAELLPTIADMGMGLPVDAARWKKRSAEAVNLKGGYVHPLLCAYVAMGEVLRGDFPRATALLNESFDEAALYKRPPGKGLPLIYQKIWMRQFLCNVQAALPVKYSTTCVSHLSKLQLEINKLLNQIAIDRKSTRLPVPAELLKPDPRDAAEAASK